MLEFAQGYLPERGSLLLAEPKVTKSETFTFEPGGKWLGPGYMGVIAAEQLPRGEVAMMAAVRAARRELLLQPSVQHPTG